MGLDGLSAPINNFSGKPSFFFRFGNWSSDLPVRGKHIFFLVKSTSVCRKKW